MSSAQKKEKAFTSPTASLLRKTTGEARVEVEHPDWDFDDEFDGGEETCGRVIVNLHLYIRDQEPGLRVLVISRDPGAPVELPAWCRMTKNEMTDSQHPYYLITLKPHLLRR